jgi:hypothetical protein
MLDLALASWQLCPLSTMLRIIKGSNSSNNTTTQTPFRSVLKAPHRLWSSVPRHFSDVATSIREVAPLPILSKSSN